MRRSLSLKRETLSVLGDDELSGIAGGSHIDCGITHGPSCDEACPTLPVNPCLGGVTQQTCITISPDVCIWTR
jgi:hypothetical protein